MQKIIFAMLLVASSQYVFSMSDYEIDDHHEKINHQKVSGMDPMQAWQEIVKYIEKFLQMRKDMNNSITADDYDDLI